MAKGPETNDVEAKVAIDTTKAKAELQELQRLGAQVRRSLEGVRSSGGGPNDMSSPLGHAAVIASGAAVATKAGTIRGAGLIPGGILAGLIADRLKQTGEGADASWLDAVIHDPPVTAADIQGPAADWRAGHAAADKADEIKFPKKRVGGVAGFTAASYAAGRSAGKGSVFARELSAGVKAQGGLNPAVALGTSFQLAALAQTVGPAFAYAAAFVGIAKASEAANDAVTSAFNKATSQGRGVFEVLNEDFGQAMKVKIGTAVRGAGSFILGSMGEIAKFFYTAVGGAVQLGDEFLTGGTALRTQQTGAQISSAHIAIQDTVDSLLGNPTSKEKVQIYNNEKEKQLQDAINRAKELAKKDAESLAEAMWKLGFPGTRRTIYRELENIAKEIKTGQAIVAFNESWNDLTFQQIIALDQGDQ